MICIISCKRSMMLPPCKALYDIYCAERILYGREANDTL